ncbi:MAG: transglutaminase-like domain-containing protein [Capsulimonadaceae bacterium]
MYVRIGYDLEFHLPAATPMLLMLYTHPDVDPCLVQQDYVRTEPELPIHTFIDGFGNRCGRILAPPGDLRIWNDMIVRDSGLPDVTNPDARQTPVESLPDETLCYLFGSRYCQMLPLSEIAWQLFGSAGEGWQRVQAVCDWVHENVRFDYLKTNPEKTAWDVWTDRVGVCRDFMHLAISFCRCLNIPARYATGYLSDIGEPPNPAPMDFSAYFEAYLDGVWYPFDARNNKARRGRVLMARGRDAVDVALTTAFGEANMTQFVVWTDEVSGPELPGELPCPANAIYGNPSRTDKL